MNKICIYAISKNESPNVEQWYESVKAADHIIVLDTGSTDDTVEKMRALGIEVHEKQYNLFRFDVARNDCLDLIPDEYNIRVSIDLDERFELSNWADVLRENWDENNPRVMYNYVWKHTEEGVPELQFRIHKIHGIDPNLRWEGAVHEHLMNMATHSRDFTNFIDLSDKITVHHYMRSDKDRDFYLQLAALRTEENPDDYYSFILRGNEERVKGDIFIALGCYQYVIDNLQEQCNSTELAAVYYYIGLCYNILGEGEKAITSFAAGIGVNKYYRDNYYGLALIFYFSGLYEAAIGILEEALKTTIRYYLWCEDNYTWTYGIYNLLSLAYFENGDKEKALANAVKALSFNPTNPDLIQIYEKCLIN